MWTSPGWNPDIDAMLTARLGRPVEVINDADAAGLAEARYGAGEGVAGTVLVITLGTGIGSAFIFDGKLVPNAELGHLEIDGFDAETKASAVAREREGLSWNNTACCCSATSPMWNSCSPPNCSSSAAASPSVPTSTCRT